MTVRLKKIIVLIILLTVLTFAGGFLLNTYSNYSRPLILNKSQMLLFIKTTDNISNGKVQINWKQVVALECAKNDNKVSNINKDNIRSMCEKFSENKTVNGQTVQGVKNFKTVLEELNLTYLQNKKAYHNLEILKNISIISEDKNNKEFIKELKPAAIDIYEKYNILPSVVLAQAILESDWGRSYLTEKANNMFGIKADSGWKGEKVKMKTKEDYNKQIKDEFRKYNSKSDSLEDYGKFLSENKRYKENGVFNAKTYNQQTKCIENAGYSTVADKQGNLIYADLLSSIIRENNLQLIDYEVEKKNFDKLA